jgi:hypothetical protein
MKIFLKHVMQKLFVEHTKFDDIKTRLSFLVALWYIPSCETILLERLNRVTTNCPLLCLLFCFLIYVTTAGRIMSLMLQYL